MIERRILKRKIKEEGFGERVIAGVSADCPITRVRAQAMHTREAIFARSGIVELYTGLLEERRRCPLQSRELSSLTSKRDSTLMAVIHLPGSNTGEGSTAGFKLREDRSIYTAPTNEFVADGMMKVER